MIVSNWNIWFNIFSGGRIMIQPDISVNCEWVSSYFLWEILKSYEQENVHDVVDHALQGFTSPLGEAPS
jgi:hypothetical protein